MKCTVSKEEQYKTLEGFFDLAQSFKNDISPTGSRDRALGYMKSLEYIQARLKETSPDLEALSTVSTYPDRMWKQTKLTVLKVTVGGTETTYTEENPGTQVRSALVNFNAEVTGVPSGAIITAGCNVSEWPDDLAGKIALVDTVNCDGGNSWCRKVEAATLKQVAAVIAVYPDDGKLLSRPGLRNCGDTLAVPVAGVSHAVGMDLLKASSITLEASSEWDESGSSNLCLDLPGGDKSKVFMLGAHLDSVMYGPGANDNGSGSALVLELVRALIKRYGTTGSPTEHFSKIKNSLRICWWGSEEWGLIGSRKWVSQMAQTELDKILGYINFDMMASPNGANFVNRGADDKYNPEASGFIAKTLAEAFEELGAPFAYSGLGGSDFMSFYEKKIPMSGLLSGASSICSEDRSKIFGCQAGCPSDPCYHRICDTPSHVDQNRQHLFSKVAASVTQKFLEDEKLDEKVKRQNLDPPALAEAEAAREHFDALFEREPDFFAEAEEAAEELEHLAADVYT